MRRQLVVIVLFSALTITGVTTLNLTSNDTILERGESLQLSCLTSGPFLKDFIKWLIPNGTELTTCFVVGMNITCNDLIDDYNSGYHVRADRNGSYIYINSLNREKDRGTWRCEYGNNETAIINIYIYTTPGGVHLVQPLQPDKDLAVESLTLTCQTENCCFPAPTIAWYYTTSTGQTGLYQSSSVSLVGNMTICTQSEVSYTSILQLNRGTTFMNNVPVTNKFLCGIEHPILGNIKYSQNSNKVTFAVKVEGITLYDSSSAVVSSNLSVVDGTPTTLHCQTTPSHPAAIITWYKGDFIINNNVITTNNTMNGLDIIRSSLTFTPSNSDHNQSIYCEAYNIDQVYKVNSIRITLHVTVNLISVTLRNSSGNNLPNTAVLINGTNVNLTCVSSTSRPTATVNWYIESSRITSGIHNFNRIGSNGLEYVESILTLTPSNTDHHNKNIYCQAYTINKNDFLQSAKSIMYVKVYVTSITMSLSGSPFISPLIFLEGQEKIIQCVSSPSRPQPQVRWWLGTEQVLDKITESESSSGNLILTTSVIILTLNRSHTHKVLYCDATVSGQPTWISSTNPDVTVQYVPYVIINVSGSMLVGSTAVLMCTAQGEPPQYTFHPWIHRVGQTEIRRLNGVNTGSLSNFTLSNISIQDMGTYICTVNNSITGLDGQIYQTGDASLYVQGPPVIDEIQTPFTGEPFKPASIQIPFYSCTSIQKLTFFKQNSSLEILNTSDVSIYIQPSNINLTFYNKKVMIPGYVAILQFSNVTEIDFGNYTLTLTNNQGSETMQLKFIASVQPYMPKNFFFVHIDEGFMVFGLEKGFNGGHDQTFIVEYRPSGNSEATWSTVDRISENNLPNPSSNGTYYIKIKKIQDGQYEFRVYAENVKGNSPAIEGVITEIKTESPPAPGFQVGAVAGGVVGVLLLVVVILVVIFVLKRRKLNPKMKEYEREEESSDQKHQDSELKLNPVYDSSNPEPLVPVYAAVTKPKKPIAQNEESNVYAQVDKSKGNKSKMAPKEKPVKASKAQNEKPVKSSKAAQKGKPVKSSRGDIYEHSPLPLKNPEEFVYENPGLVAADPNESVYENPGPSASKGHLADKDGLQYAVLKLGPPTTKGGKPVIHGLENRTEYAEIAYGKRGEPLPNSDEEKKDGAK